MFWGVTLESGKRYSQVVNTSYHLSMAALEPRQSGSSSHKRVMLMLEHAKAEFLLCTLDYEKALQVPLDLSFVEGEEVTFFLNGEGTVHLTGYLTDVNGLGEPDATSEEDSSSAEEEVEDHNLTSRLLQVEDEDSEDSDFIPDKAVAKSKRAQNGTKKAAASRSNNSLVELVSNEIGSDDDSSDEDFEADMVEDAADDEEDEEQSDEDEEQSDEEDSDENGEEEEEKDSEEEEEVAAPVVPLAERKRKHTQQEAAKHSPNKSSLSNASIVTADGASPEEGTRKKRKRNKKDSSSSLPVVQQEQSPKGKNQTVLQGGVQSQDLRVGSGPVAKPGKSVHVYYTGKLANNREFDSCRSGKAFSFKLGKGDVIKGWETGIQGMRVGGKRRLVIPPSQGYGSTRMGDIPPNSTLYFDVELKAVS